MRLNFVIYRYQFQIPVGTRTSRNVTVAYQNRYCNHTWIIPEVSFIVIEDPGGGHTQQIRLQVREEFSDDLRAHLTPRAFDTGWLP